VPSDYEILVVDPGQTLDESELTSEQTTLPIRDCMPENLCGPEPASQTTRVP
jgi:hypothetical protein